MGENSTSTEEAEERARSLTAVTENARHFLSLPKELQADPDISRAAVAQNGMLIQYAPALQNDPDVVRAAVRANWRTIRHASEALRLDPEIRRFAEEERQRQCARETQAVNFLWLNLDLPPPPDPADGSIRLPMPEQYIKNIRRAGRRHPAADLHLWVDSRRLTPRQFDYLEAVVEEGLPNVHVRDLCSIPEYANEELYSRAETNEKWREPGYDSLIWRQVDAAKILISLQGDYDQRFFADLDHAHVDIRSEAVQGTISAYGLIIGGNDDDSGLVENQLWGFDRSREDLFRRYYTESLQGSYRGILAYMFLYAQLADLEELEKLPVEEIIFTIGNVGSKHAEQPGHAWSDYPGRATVPASELQNVFNKRSLRIEAAPPAAARPVAAQCTSAPALV